MGIFVSLDSSLFDIYKNSNVQKSEVVLAKF